MRGASPAQPSPTNECVKGNSCHLYEPATSTPLRSTWPSHAITRAQLQIPRDEATAPIEPSRPPVPHWPISAELEYLDNDFDRRHVNYLSHD